MVVMALHPAARPPPRTEVFREVMALSVIVKSTRSATLIAPPSCRAELRTNVELEIETFCMSYMFPELDSSTLIAPPKAARLSEKMEFLIVSSARPGRT